MEHCLAGAPADVGHKPPPIIQLLGCRYVGGKSENRYQHVTVVRAHVSGRSDVANRDHQDMGRSLRVDIAKRNRTVVAGDDVGRGITRCYRAEQAVLAHEDRPLGVGDPELDKTVGESVFALIQQQ